jgi:RNA polymerase sigma-70 factor (ECF subfamily)
MAPDSTAQSVFASARSGNRDAFAALVRQHQSMVYSLAWNYLHDQGLAEELAQEVFLELHRSLVSLESADHVTNWLRRVTVHRCIDQTRRDRNRPRLTLAEIAEPSATASQDGDYFLSDRLRKLTASLPEKARCVLLLRYQEDMEPAEIARTLDMPLNTVKSHLQRSLGMLRSKLERLRVSP